MAEMPWTDIIQTSEDGWVVGFGVVLVKSEAWWRSKEFAGESLTEMDNFTLGSDLSLVSSSCVERSDWIISSWPNH